MMQKLSSSKAALIRDLVRHKKARETERVFVVEGLKPIGELLASHPTYFQALIMAQTSAAHSDQRFLDHVKQAGCALYVCQDRIFDTLSDLTTPSGMLAVLRRPVWDQETVFKRPTLFGFYGERLQDPTNVGSIIRTSVAFGLDALWLSSDSVDVFNPKVVRATAGALLKLPIFSMQDVALFARFNCAILGAEVPGPHVRPIQDIRTLPPRAVVALGNESQGLSAAVLTHASARFHIPIHQAAESLNVAAAAAIAAFTLGALRDEPGR
jgi:TrmH family RNA methyltransferase